MKVVCVWCAKEGKLTLVDEKVPVDDWQESHGICSAHESHVEMTHDHLQVDPP